ncbi:MAG: hypothetical protein ACLTYN_16310 [Dysosmobacter welbionis]
MQPAGQIIPGTLMMGLCYLGVMLQAEMTLGKRPSCCGAAVLLNGGLGQED